MADANSPAFTSEATVGTTLRNIITQDLQKVNGENEAGYAEDYAAYQGKNGGQRFSRNITGNEAEAARQFGTTEDFREAGYIIGDGRMLRFTNDSNSGTRDYDHRAIAKVYGQSVDFNKNHGFN